MRTTTRWLFALVAAAALAFIVSACGSDDDDSSEYQLKRLRDSRRVRRTDGGAR